MGAGKFADRTTYEYPAFIMIDLNMPRAVGFTVLQHLKDNPEWAIVPTMVFSSSSDLDDIKKSYMLGASSYHVKPTSIATLREHLDVLHKYWMTCEIPEVHACGRRRTTDSGGKIGDRFGQASGSAAQVSAHFPTSVRDGFAADAKCSDRRNTTEKALDAATAKCGLRLRRLDRSMSRRGNCYDNAAMESFWSTLKTETTLCTRSLVSGGEDLFRSHSRSKKRSDQFDRR